VCGVLDRIAHAVAMLESHADPAVREAAHVLMQGIDAVHRDGIAHLLDAVRDAGGEPAVERLLADPAIRQLLISYALIPGDRTVRPDPEPEVVRQPDAAGVTTKAASKNLRTIEDRPVYLDALSASDLPRGALRGVTVNDTSVLLANVDGEIHALGNHCGDSPLPLEFGKLRGSELICPWHGCRYDIRTGRRVDAEKSGLQVFRVAVAGGRIQVALNVVPVERD
jgi:nitrite reductase/ring-hydroxylating ferredoxin subunit